MQAACRKVTGKKVFRKVSGRIRRVYPCTGVTIGFEPDSV
jgi:hypothetical protein